MEIHGPLPVSQSAIWRLQSDYYRRRGPQAWTEISSLASCNAFNAEATARLIAAHAEDLAAAGQLGPDGRLFIFEFGALTGQLGFQVAKRLEAFLSSARRRRIAGPLDFTYVLTDVAEDSVARWVRAPKAKPLVESGRLDFARFDATEPERMISAISGDDLLAASDGHACVLIANYMLHILPLDVFRVAGGAIEEFRMRAESSAAALPEAPDRDFFATLTFTPEPTPLTHPRYEEPEIEAVLASYADAGKDFVLRFPSAALRLIHDFRRRAGNRLMLVVSDVAVAEDERATERTDFPRGLISQPCGASTATVNLNAIRRYFEGAGGRLICRNPSNQPMDSYVFLAGPGELVAEEARQMIEGFSPLSFDRLMDELNRSPEALGREGLLALLELSGGDEQIFRRIADRLAGLLAPDVSPAFAGRLLAVLERVRESVLDEEAGHQLLPLLARICRKANRPAAALAYYQAMLPGDGRDYVTHYYVGSCQAVLGRRDEARVSLLTAGRLGPPGWTAAEDALARL